MAAQATTIQEWYILNASNLITCPHHPGDLKLTLSACRFRRRKALEWSYGTPLDNLFVYGCEQHLLACRECRRVPLGKANLSLVKGGLKPGSRFRDPFPKEKDGKQRLRLEAGEEPAGRNGEVRRLRNRRGKG